MHSTRRTLALFLIFSLLLISGCGLIPRTAPSPSPTKAAPGTSASPGPSSTHSAEASRALAVIDREIFGEYATMDALSYHLLLAHPENFKDLGAPEAGWGALNYEEAQASTEREKAWLARLHEIDRAALLPAEQLTYDTLAQHLLWSIESFDYYYYNEVLTTLVGLHSNLPLYMTFYDIDSLEDVEGYLALLADTPRYFAEVLRFEQEKSRAGLFMTDEALEQVLGQLQEVIDARETLFLRATFPEALAELKLNDAQRAAYEKQNDTLVDALIDAYQKLYDGLAPLAGTGTNDGGLMNYGAQGLKYFGLSLRQSACADVTPEAAVAILEKEIEHQVEVILDCMRKEPGIYDDFDSVLLSVGTTQENLDFLEALIAKSYPALPPHSVTFADCPEELEDQYSPAAYLVPPVDDPSENLIILNTKTLGSETRLLDTLAHEGYPGHMYHYQYIRTLVGQTGYARQALDLTGYYEAWSQAGELFFDAHNTRFSNDYCLFMNANATLGYLLLPALVSIKVNCSGAGAKEATALVAEYYGDETAAMLGPAYYRYAIENPFYYLKYAMGHALFQQKLREAEAACGGSFDRLSYNKTFLDLGPTYFNFILPAMDAWIEENAG